MVNLRICGFRCPFFLRPLSLFEPEEGMLFSLRDMDGDGAIFGDEEVSGYDTQARSWGGALPGGLRV